MEEKIFEETASWYSTLAFFYFIVGIGISIGAGQCMNSGDYGWTVTFGLLAIGVFLKSAAYEVRS